MRTGVYLPSFSREDTHGNALARFAVSAEQAGFESLWVVEHLLDAAPSFAGAFLSPLPTLAFAAAVTSQIKLGTGVLVAPQYHPLRIARDVVTLQQLSDDRFILGVGPGWSPKEYESLGLSVRLRGKMLDELLDALRLLLSGESSSFEGSFYRFSDVSMLPRVAAPEIWVAGRTPLGTPGGTMANGVIRRIASADRWYATRAWRTQRDIELDWKQIRAGTGHSSFSYLTWVHVVDSDNHDRAVAEQTKAFEEVFGPLTSSDLASRAMLGTPEEIVSELKSVEAIGMDYVVFATATNSTRQVDLLSKLILPAL